MNNNTLPLSRLGAGLERINHQYDRKLFTELTDELKDLQEKVLATPDRLVTSSMLDNSRLRDIIMKRTGMDIDFIPDDVEGNICLLSFPMSSFNVLLDGHVKTGPGGLVAPLHLYDKYKKVLTGVIDYERGSVGGIFSEVPMLICLYDGMFTIPNMLPEEVAAIILHEVGHGWSNLAMIHYKMTTNLVLGGGVAALVSEPDKQRKIAIMLDIENTLNVDISDKKDLMAYDKFENYYIVILSAYHEKLISALGSSAYDESMAEQIADQYAARHGCGKYLVSAATKLRSSLLRDKQQSTRVFSVGSVLSYAILATLCITLMPVCVVVFMQIDVMGGAYDKTKDRFIRVRNESVDALKDQSLSKDLRKLLLNDIKEMDEIIATAKNEYTTTDKLAVLVRSGQRKQFRAKKLQQELEALLNNPLYITAAKLKG